MFLYIIYDYGYEWLPSCSHCFFLTNETIKRILVFTHQDFFWDHDPALQQDPVGDWSSWWSSLLKQTLRYIVYIYIYKLYIYTYLHVEICGHFHFITHTIFITYVYHILIIGVKIDRKHGQKHHIFGPVLPKITARPFPRSSEARWSWAMVTCCCNKTWTFQAGRSTVGLRSWWVGGPEKLTALPGLPCPPENRPF